MSIELPLKLKNIVEKEGFNDIERILTSPKIALRKIGLTNNEVDLLKAVASKDHFDKFMTASKCSIEMSRNWKRISFGCAALDAISNNGIATRGITEICGESSSGKSQICLQLALVVQLSEELGGLGRGAVFICTEDAFPSKRLHQMADSFAQRFGSIAEPVDFLDNIFIEHISDSERLLNCVSNRLPQLMQTKSIGLIVIDSVGAIFRLESNAIARANDMRRLVLNLQALSDEHACAVVCINQVTSVIGSTSGCDNKLIPCLGLAWSNLVTTRVQIHKTDECYLYNAFDENDEKIEEIPLTVRKFEILFSPELTSDCAEFLISPEGVVDVR